MLLVTAALAEELRVVLGFCKNPVRENCAGMRVLSAQAGDNSLCLLRTGVGPARAGSRLQKLLPELNPSEILTVGYSGALDESLKVGDLVVAQRALLLSGPSSGTGSLDEIALAGSWDLARGEGLYDIAELAGLSVCRGTILTSPYIIGDPAQKKTLHRRFGAVAVDMESGSLARAAESHGIPYTCVRAISDGANDEFLAPVSYDPESSPMNRALKVLAAGNWLRRYHEWRECAALARESLRQFLSCYFRCPRQAPGVRHANRG